MSKFEQVEIADTKCAPRLDLPQCDLSPSLKDLNVAKGMSSSNDKNGCFAEMPQQLLLINPFTGIADAGKESFVGGQNGMKEGKIHIKVDDLCHAWERIGKNDKGNIDDEVFRTEKKEGGMIKGTFKELDSKVPSEGRMDLDMKNHDFGGILKHKAENEIIIKPGRGSKEDIVINSGAGSNEKIIISPAPGSKEKIDITTNSKTGQTEIKIEPKHPVIFT